MTLPQSGSSVVHRGSESRCFGQSAFGEGVAHCRAEEDINLHHLPSPVVFWSGASFVSAVSEVIELACRRLGERLPANYETTSLS